MSNILDLEYEYESAFSYIQSIGKDNLSINHLKEWQTKLDMERDTLKRRFIQIHIVIISNVLNQKDNEKLMQEYFDPNFKYHLPREPD